LAPESETVEGALGGAPVAAIAITPAISPMAVAAKLAANFVMLVLGRNGGRIDRIFRQWSRGAQFPSAQLKLLSLATIAGPCATTLIVGLIYDDGLRMMLGPPRTGDEPWGGGERAQGRVRARSRDDNTRRAYGRALGSFFAFLEDGSREGVQDIGPLNVRDYLEAAKANGLSPALKQHMAAIRMLLDRLVTGGVLEHNPALSVKAPRQKLGKGKTPVLTGEEAGDCCAPSRPTASLASVTAL
jgi:hypothetical protein